MVPGATGGGRDRGPRGDEPRPGGDERGQRGQRGDERGQRGPCGDERGPCGLGGNYRLTPDPRKLSVLRTRRVTRMSA